MWDVTADRSIFWFVWKSKKERKQKKQVEGNGSNTLESEIVPNQARRPSQFFKISCNNSLSHKIIEFFFSRA